MTLDTRIEMLYDVKNEKFRRCEYMAITSAVGFLILCSIIVFVDHAINGTYYNM